MNIKEIVERVKGCLEKEDIKDQLFRALVFFAQSGDVPKAMIHDAKLNPNARPFITQSAEQLAAGELIVQFIALMVTRYPNFDFEKAIELALQNWETADWRKVKKDEEEKSQICRVKGKIAYPGVIKGTAYVVSDEHPLQDCPNAAILVMESSTTEIVQVARKIIGIVTDQGGLTCHAAVIARDSQFLIPCLVATGNASKVIKHGSTVRFVAKTKETTGFVEVIKEA